jgi:hypothetical protein
MKHRWPDDDDGVGLICLFVALRFGFPFTLRTPFLEQSILIIKASTNSIKVANAMERERRSKYAEREWGVGIFRPFHC